MPCYYGKRVRVLHRLAGLNECGEVDNTIKWLLIISGGEENLLEVGTVAQLALNQFHAGRQQVAATVAQVVVNNGFMSIANQKCRDGTSYVPCTAGNQYPHKKTVLSATV